MSFEAPKFTTAGKRLELRALEGEELIFTSIKIGSGQITTQTPSALTDLIKVEETGSINTIKRHDGYVTIQAVFNNASRAAGFYWREVGLYAQDPDDRTKEILYAYQNAYDLAEYINPTSLVEKKINIVAIVDDAESVQALIDESLVYATVESVSNKIAEHNTANNAHSDKFDNKADKLENGHGIVRSVNHQYADDNGNVNLSGIDTGMIIPFAGNGDIPAGFLLCDGASVLRDTYPDLFKVIGTTYGAVDDTHFNLPDLTSRFIEGSDVAGDVKEAGLPNITGGLAQIWDANTNGAFSKSPKVTGKLSFGTEALCHGIEFNASKSNHIYGNSTTVQPPAVTMRYIIKSFAGASASSTDIEITKVANDVADKANRDLSNLSENGRKAFFPSDTFIELPLTGDNNRRNYEGIAPANGFINAIGNATNVFENFELRARGSSLNNGNSYAPFIISNSAYGRICHSTIPVKKGDKIEFISSTNGTIVYSHLRFIYAEGEV